MNKLSYYSYYVEDRIDVLDLSVKNYIGVDNILPNKGGVVNSEYLPESGTAISFKKGDILIGNIRPYFKKIWLATFDGGCSSDVLCIRSNGKMIPECLYAILSQDLFFNYDMAGSKGSKMPRGDKNHIMNFPIPELENEEKIGHFIVSINKKLKVNNKIITELESMAKTLYDYWFLQFEFPNEEGKPYKSSGGKMVYNEELKRDIPEGWKVENVKSHCKITWGQCPDGANILPINTDEDSMLYCSGAGDMRNGLLVDCQARTNASRRTANINDILMSVAGSIGAVCYCDKTISLGRAAVAFSPKRNEELFTLMSVKSFSDRMKIVSSGSIQKVVNDNHLNDMNLVFDDEVLMKFSKYNSLLNKMIFLCRENQELASLRDFLLPMLMNGQIFFYK